ncbi:MAG: FecR domain-containing protein [Spirochaetota bacterium]|nr:FecR domain-containing protein [Spirochaetota bacterium]
MRLYAIIIGILILSAGLFGDASSGDYQVITVKPGENLDSIAVKYLKSTRFTSDLLRYNRLRARDIKAGLKIKVPYSISVDRAARIKFLKGQVERSKEGVWSKVHRSGVVLLKKDRVKTGDNSLLELIFDDGSLLQLQSNSVMSLREFEYSRKGRAVNLNLKKGSLYTVVARLGKKGRFQISTVSAVVGVRGTEFYVSVSKDDKVDVEVYKGKVNVKGSKKSVTVETGHKTSVKKGKEPSTPSKIRKTRQVRWGR